uniref:SHSP domain-containing protein n=1 Tax=Chelydra serpentina TaxID=8475 RepID=A0A8C3XNS0_CHESE
MPPFQPPRVGTNPCPPPSPNPPPPRPPFPPPPPPPLLVKSSLESTPTAVSAPAARCSPPCASGGSSLPLTAPLHAGTPGAVRPCSLGSNVRAGGDTYQVTVDVSQFEPQDVVVTTYNYHIIIQAEKVAEDGTVSNTFTHKCQLPEDMDPLSVSCALTASGLLVITAKRGAAAKAGETPPPLYRTEVKL